MTREEILAKSRKDYEWEDDLHKEIARKNQRRADIGEGFLLLLLVLTNHFLGGPKQVSQIFWMLLWYKNASINMINGYTDKTPGVFGFWCIVSDSPGNLFLPVCDRTSLKHPENS